MTTHRKTRAVRGFTIVELLVVIVVIAILAAIAIVSYTGIQTRTIESSMQSDLHTATNQVEIDRTTTGDIPTDANSINNGAGLSASNGTTLTYTTKPYGYCLAATNPKTNKSFAVKSTTGSITEGDCQATVSTFAGTGVAGSANGTTTTAQFDGPSDIVIDSDGNYFISDYSANRIRKITSNGTVTTLAGSGTAGSANGTGTSASFNAPYGIAIDSANVLYVNEINNNRIRKITQAGVVTTFVGSTQGYTEATGTSAQFNHPFGLAINKTTNMMYVGDAWNVRIRKVTTAGVTSAFVGNGTKAYTNGTGTAAQFKDVDRMDVDTAGNIYFADYSDHRIRKITPAGVVTTLAGSGVAGFTNGTGTAAQFNSPTDIAVDASGNVYVADEQNNVIRKVTSAGVVTTFAGSGAWGFTDGSAATAQFNGIAGLAVDSLGNVYVTDPGNHRIRKITP